MTIRSVDRGFAGFFGVVVALGVLVLLLLGVCAYFGGTVPTFPPALQSWTGWFASVAAIIVSVRVLWAATVAMQKYADRP
jgi:hypothetical protein